MTPRYRALEVSISGPSLFKPGIDAELILQGESHDGAPAVGAFAVTTTFFKSDGGSSAIAGAIELTERNAGVKRFYVRVPLNDATCCRVTDLSSYRSGSCCLNGASVELDRDAPSLRAVVNGRRRGRRGRPRLRAVRELVRADGAPRRRSGRVREHTRRASGPRRRRDGGDGDGGVEFRPARRRLRLGGGGARPRRDALGQCRQGRNAVVRRDGGNAPRRPLVAYVAHDGSGGEAANVVACAKKIGVTFAADATAGFGLPETLALTLDASEAAPGDAVRLTATSSAPGSRVFVLAHDVSVLIQSGGRQSAMSASKILEAASAAGGAGADAGTPFDSTTMAASWCWPPRTWTRASWFCSPP